MVALLLLPVAGALPVPPLPVEGFNEECVLIDGWLVFYDEPWTWACARGSVHPGTTTVCGGVPTVGYMEKHPRTESPDGSCIGPFTATAIASSSLTSCILHSSGDVTCRGSQHSTYGWMDARHLSVGGNHACVVRANGNVACWGVEGRFEVEPYSGGDAVGVAVGSLHTCVLTATGNVLCNGDPRYAAHGQYEGGDAIGVATQGSHTCILLTNGVATCRGAWGSPSWHEGVASLHGGRNVCAVYVSGAAACGIPVNQWLSYDGDDAITASAHHGDMCVVTTSGNVRCVGENAHGWHDPYDGGDAVSVALGSNHVCILLVRGDVTCRGPASREAADDYAGVADVPRLDASGLDCMTLTCYRDAGVDRSDGESAATLEYAHRAVARADERAATASGAFDEARDVVSPTWAWLAGSVPNFPRTLHETYDASWPLVGEVVHDQRAYAAALAAMLFDATGRVHATTFDHLRHDIGRADAAHDWAMDVFAMADDDVCRVWNGQACP